MSDVDYFLDMPSSPDPLAEGMLSHPSHARSATRRLPKLHANPRSRSRSQSPRKRTFELDVGDSHSPQRIRVTVEAEDHPKSTNVNRKLFPPSSPTRSARRRDTITAITTTVPLNDELGLADDKVTTPRKRGRPRRISNGTPMPKSRKRAGTPIHRVAKQARQDSGSPEAGPSSDALIDFGDDDTPKPKTRIRKTPKNSSTISAVPSSQISSTSAGRKRGRPRKVPIEQTPATDARNETTGAASSAQALASDAKYHPADPTTTAANDPPKRNDRISSPIHPNRSEELRSHPRISHSPIPSDHEQSESDADIIGGGFQDHDPPSESDVQSEGGHYEDGGMRFDRQDTVADASEFSMIAVESLPSFQASFHASFHAENGESAEEAYEMGEETSQIVNRTLDSLRRSLRSETGSPSHAIEHEQDTSNNSERGLSRSPRRPKHPMPLSRQVLVGRGNVDDSFSTIPDSILHAATPGRIHAAQTAFGSRAKDDGYDDSFSEIPEAVLEAATPRTTRLRETRIQESPADNGELYQTVQSAARGSSADYGSNRLPTPEETSSSNAEYKKAREEDEPAIPEPQQSSPPDHIDVPSSPPTRNRPRALDFGQSNIQQELSLVHEHSSTSPPRQQPAKTSQNQHQTLDAPPTSIRPSLSPIVRVGRTLQNVMSDNSSPEVREVNLGSPFRGPGNNEPTYRTSLVRSPSPSTRNRGATEAAQTAGPSMRLDRSLRSDRDRSSASFSRGAADAEDPFIPNTAISSNAKYFEESVNSKQPESNIPRVSVSGEMTGPRNGGIIPLAHDRSPQGTNNQQPQSTSSRDQIALLETHGTSASQLPAVPGAGLDDQHEDIKGAGSLQDLDQNIENASAEEYEDDFDVWEIEASRTSPFRAQPPRAAPKPLESEIPPPRRSKIPSPWRKTARRLIYKEQIASSSQIEVEEGSQSEVEQDSLVRPRQRPQATDVQPPQQSQFPEPPLENTMRAQPRRPGHTSSPNPSHHSVEEYAGPAEPADAEETDDMMDYEEPEEAHGFDQAYDEPQETPAGPSTIQPLGGDSAMDMTEYSILAQQGKTGSKSQDKPASTKSRIFGKFDLMSFFSSPAALPDKTLRETNTSRPTNKPQVSQPALETGGKRQTAPKEPPKALWSTGLFPPIPQKTVQPSPERRGNLFSPGKALQSNDTVADTYEPSTTSNSPSPSPSPSHPESGAPSTPERQVFPPIQQKRDFTPRLGQPRGSLFSQSQPSSDATQSEANEDSPEESGNGHDDSVLTEGSEYERVPPRGEPSRWDRNLSPTKSCFRSPLKPTTPGRIVSFGDERPSQLAQTLTSLGLQSGASGSNIISQGPPLRPNLEGKENQSNFLPQQPKATLANTITTGQNNAKRPEISRSSQPRPFVKRNNILLSQTAWSKQHWARFDEILQLRRHDSLRFQQLCPLPPRDQRRSSVLLGREVSAQGAKLVLEPWHLDVVEAFKFEVGGWDERVLARRLFALIVGEEKRRAAKENKDTSVTPAAAVSSVY